MSDAPTRLTALLAGRYDIARELGAGGMATVYLAHDVKHDRDVAIKVLHPDLGAVLGGERFLAEIRTTARLQHPHILPVLDSGDAEGLLFYVMPLVTGETLRARLERERQLPIDDAVRIAREVADALGYAHGAGVIHRDIKPENILLQGGHALVADFGIALAVQTAGGARLTQTGLSLGTPQYMSPEQAMGERSIDARSDIYSLGVVTYEMLAGEPPFTGPTVQSIVARVLSEDPRGLVVQRRAIPASVEEATLRALEKLPADRFASAAAFAEALTSTNARTTHASGANVRATQAFSRWRTAIAAAGWLAALGAIGWSATRRGGAVAPTEYDVGLPDSAMLSPGLTVGFAVAPRGDFLVYRTERAGVAELWSRSLLDATVHPIEGTKGADFPTISPDGKRLAFVRVRGDAASLETIDLAGGAGASLGPVTVPSDLQWLPDGRLQMIDGDGVRARWVAPSGGPSTSVGIHMCQLPATVPDGTSMICNNTAGGGGFQVFPKEGAQSRKLHLASSASSPVIGSHFRVIDGRYLTYVSTGGELFAAPIDLATGAVGRSVRMASSFSLRDYNGAAAYAISASGALVYAQGDNRALGALVRVDAKSVDTLPIGREPFINFVISPNARRVAATVTAEDGVELRVYDLTSGRHTAWVRGANVASPVWNEAGDRIVFTRFDSLFMGNPDAPGRPEFLIKLPGLFHAHGWGRDGRVVGSLFDPGLALSVDISRRPITVDTLRAGVNFPRVSPDGRWVVYCDSTYSELWLEPLPRDGHRYQFASGVVGEAHWLSSDELAFLWSDATGRHVDRMKLTASRAAPLGARTRWAEIAEYRDTMGQSSTLSPDGRFVYLRGAADQPARYLRVVPGWVRRMEKAVEDANR